LEASRRLNPIIARSDGAKINAVEEKKHFNSTLSATGSAQYCPGFLHCWQDAMGIGWNRGTDGGYDGGEQ